MTAQDLSALLSGREVGIEMTASEEEEARRSGLVVVFGASDDLCEMRGAITEEVDCYDGRTIFLDRSGGLLSAAPCGIGESGCCPYLEKAKAEARTIKAIWGEGAAWTYKTDIQHEKFVILKDEEVYCRGIVFEMAALNA